MFSHTKMMFLRLHVWIVQIAIPLVEFTVWKSTLPDSLVVYNFKSHQMMFRRKR